VIVIYVIVIYVIVIYVIVIYVSCCLYLALRQREPHARVIHTGNSDMCVLLPLSCSEERGRHAMSVIHDSDVCLSACACLRVCACVCVWERESVYLRVFVCVCVYTYIYVVAFCAHTQHSNTLIYAFCVCTCVYLCVFVCAYTRTHTRTLTYLCKYKPFV